MKYVEQEKGFIKEVKHLYFIAGSEYENGFDEEKCAKRTDYIFFRFRKWSFICWKRVLLSSTDEKLMEFNKEAGEKRKEQIEKHRMNCKNRWMVLTGRSVLLSGVSKREHFLQAQFTMKRNWKKKNRISGHYMDLHGSILPLTEW